VPDIIYKPIGVVHSPFKEPKGTPIQPPSAEGVAGTVEVFPEYAEGLEDLDGFSHVILLYHFHLSKRSPLRVKPFMDDEAHGVFAMRGPSRPNPIGLSIVRLVGVEGNLLQVRDVDIVDGTPLLDIKPYVPAFDARDEARIGWLGEQVHKLPTMEDDGRFSQ
jgi:tRNA-Thr(GGU) m(6)t(6)A37 methyltransferase TsaA